MDDAGIPSLLSLPYLDYCEKDDDLYQNTRCDPTNAAARLKAARDRRVNLIWNLKLSGLISGLKTKDRRR